MRYIFRRISISFINPYEICIVKASPSQLSLVLLFYWIEFFQPLNIFWPLKEVFRSHLWFTALLEAIILQLKRSRSIWKRKKIGKRSRKRNKKYNGKLSTTIPPQPLTTKSSRYQPFSFDIGIRYHKNEVYIWTGILVERVKIGLILLKKEKKGSITEINIIVQVMRTWFHKISNKPLHKIWVELRIIHLFLYLWPTIILELTDKLRVNFN